MSAHILSAHDLTQGDVVYLTKSQEWSGNIMDANVVESKEELEKLSELGTKATKDNQVIDARTVPVTVEDDIIIPKHIKERIRAKGPSVHPHLGKQAENEAIANAFHSF